MRAGARRRSGRHKGWPARQRNSSLLASARQLQALVRLRQRNKAIHFIVGFAQTHVTRIATRIGITNSTKARNMTRSGGQLPVQRDRPKYKPAASAPAASQSIVSVLIVGRRRAFITP